MTVTNQSVAAVVSPRPVALSQHGPGPDEAHAGQDAQRQAHQVQLDERVVRLAGRGQQQVRLKHRHRRRQAHQQRGPQPGGVAVLPVHADDRAGDRGQQQPQRDLAWGDGGLHGGWRR
jgi:hypothetical protein